MKQSRTISIRNLNSYFNKTNTVTKYIPSSNIPLMKKFRYLLPARLETFNARP